jgi:hypothetical protein
VNRELRRQGLTFFTGVAISIGLTVVVQLWLLSVSVEAYESGDARTTIGSASASLVLFAMNAAFLVYVWRFERRLRRLGGR